MSPDQNELSLQTPVVGQTARFENVKPTLLLEVSSLFPFDFFPNTIRVSTHSIAVVDTFFFGTKETKTILIEDIFNVDLMTTPFFCALQLTNRQPMMPVIEVKFLRRSDGEKLKNLIQGLILLKSENIDLSKYTAEQVIARVSKVGALAAT